MSDKGVKKFSGQGLWVQIGIHLSLWFLYFLLNYIFLQNYQIDIRPNFIFTDAITYILVFYISYLALIPFLLFRRKILLFVVLSILLLCGGFIIKREYRAIAFEKFVNERNDILQVPSDPFIDSNQQRDKSIEEFIPPPPIPDQRFITPRDFGLLSGIFLIYMASITISFIQKWRSDEGKKQERENERITAELKYLKQQINPHFLFNSLNSIYSMTISHPSPASDAILKLSSILRYMLYASDNEKVSLSEELDVIHNYLELQKLRITDKVKVKYSLNGDASSFKIEPHILMPLFENAFKYGVDNITDSFIYIKVEIIDDQLKAEISNKMVLKGGNIHDSGIGIRNIMRRLELLYPNKYHFNILEKENVFTVNLTIVLNR